ncbi:MAG: hypothetical protein BAJALOKI1v1_1610005 [Promethearchaeota archaeon]|nr:MAG: hypothetical protein BAJALOKI1v1_1610005 [Candidatus Lokiarchaeota archaeon]
MKIENINSVKKFISKMVPELKDDEVLIYFVFVRKKYCPEVKNHHQMVFRNILRDNSVEYILHKIKKIPDEFIDYKTNISYKKNCYSTYIDLIPKSTLKAFIKFQKEMTDLMYQSFKNKELLSEFSKIKAKLLSNIHKSSSRKPYIMIDIDTKEEDIIDNVLEKIVDRPEWISETRGGYHLIYKKTSETCKVIYTELITDKSFKEVIEVKSEVMTPIPGLLQGGFLVNGLEC